MSWKNVNLEEVLQKEKQRKEKKQSDEILNVFRDMLSQDDSVEEEVFARLFGYNREGAVKIKWRSLDPSRIYDEEQIFQLCKQYRLRFLSVKYFKGEIPYEAISRVKKLYRDGHGDLDNFRILAPAPMFKLVEKDKDPLLFLSLGEGRYYLVHKWGRDLSIWRKLAVFPFRSFRTLLSCVAALALFVVLMIPDSVIMGPYDKTSLNLRVIFFIYLFIAFSGLTVLYGFSRIKNFNGSLWDSKYLD